MKFYVYHEVPEHVVGNILYPLNCLKSAMPVHYDQALLKYVGREHLTEEIVPFLNCLWGDVVNFLCVPPDEIFRELKQLGISYQMRKFYKIEVEDLEENKTIYHSNLEGEQYTRDVSELSHATTIPEKTRQYFEKCKRQGSFPNIFVHLTHLLYYGEVDIEKCSIVGIDAYDHSSPT